MNDQLVNEFLFRSKQTNLEPVNIKKILFLLIVFRIITLKYRPEENEILFNLGKSSNDNIIIALNDPKYWLNINTK